MAKLVCEGCNKVQASMLNPFAFKVYFRCRSDACSMVWCESCAPAGGFLYAGRKCAECGSEAVAARDSEAVATGDSEAVAVESDVATADVNGRMLMQLRKEHPEKLIWLGSEEDVASFDRSRLVGIQRTPFPNESAALVPFVEAGLRSGQVVLAPDGAAGIVVWCIEHAPHASPPATSYEPPKLASKYASFVDKLYIEPKNGEARHTHRLLSLRQIERLDDWPPESGSGYEDERWRSSLSQLERSVLHGELKSSYPLCSWTRGRLDFSGEDVRFTYYVFSTKAPRRQAEAVGQIIATAKEGGEFVDQIWLDELALAELTPEQEAQIQRAGRQQSAVRVLVIVATVAAVAFAIAQAMAYFV